MVAVLIVAVSMSEVQVAVVDLATDGRLIMCAQLYDRHQWCRVGRCPCPWWLRGWHTTATCSSLWLYQALGVAVVVVQAAAMVLVATGRLILDARSCGERYCCNG